LKSLDFIPNIGYSVKNGITLLNISVVFFICSKAIFVLSLQYTGIFLLSSFDSKYKLLKYFDIPINKSFSLICKQVSYINLTLLPILVVAFSIEILNDESPDANPETHDGFGIPLNLYSGLSSALILGNASNNSLDKPLFKFAFRDTIFNNPSSVKCSLFFINSKHCSNNKKSEYLALTNG
jgi:hypothetical protein